MHLTRPLPDDGAARLEQLERVLQEWRAALHPSEHDDASPEHGGTRVAPTLARIKSLTALLQSSLVRPDADLVDRITMQLLLADYTDVVHELRVSTDGAARTLKEAANIVANAERLVRGDAKSRG
jgi:hypothetical protein